MNRPALPWYPVAASVTGESHRERGIGCQDASEYVVLEDTLIVALADGAGCAEQGAVGAGLAARVAVEALLRQPGRLLEQPERRLRKALRAARGAVAGTASRHGDPIESYATTLMLALVSDEKGCFLHLGDGAIVGTAPEMGPVLISAPQQGRFANETWFITSEVALRKARYCETGPLNYLAMFTDGLQDLLLDSAPFGKNPPPQAQDTSQATRNPLRPRRKMRCDGTFPNGSRQRQGRGEIGRHVGTSNGFSTAPAPGYHRQG